MLQRSIVFILASMSIYGLMIAQTNPPKGPSPEPKADATPTPPPATDYDICWGVKIPMRDKVELNATLYVPHTPDGSTAKLPVVVTLTVMCLRWSMFAVVEILAASSNRSPMNRATVTTW